MDDEDDCNFEENNDWLHQHATAMVTLGVCASTDEFAITCPEDRFGTGYED
jgi:hypothetical protein